MKRAFRVFVRVGRESVDQWVVVGVKHDLASLSVVAKVLDVLISCEEFAPESAASPFSRCKLLGEKG